VRPLSKPFRLIRTSFARSILACCFCGVLSSAVHAQGNMLYVAPNGSNAAPGNDQKKPRETRGITDAKSVRIAANCTARKSAGPHGVQWRGTGGSNWMVESAGMLNLKNP
jgi:hypothetical protein